MSHEQQIIRALRAAVGNYKVAIDQKDAAIKLQKEAITHLRTVVAHMVPHTNYSDEDKATLMGSLGLDVTEVVEESKNDKH